MMVHPLPPELPITVILPQEPSRTSFVDMPHKPVTLFLEDSVGIVTVSLLSTKLIKNSKSQTRDKFSKWESPNTTKPAEALS